MSKSKKIAKPPLLFAELSGLIEQSKRQIVAKGNEVLNLLFWQVGKRINENILQNKRAEYATEIVSTLSTQLVNVYGKNFELRNLRRMMQFAAQFSDFEIVAPLAPQLSWSHIVEVLPIKNMEAKLYYANQASENNYTVRELRKQIETRAFERTELANIQISSSNIIPANTFKDPYILNFLGLQNTYQEKDVEQAILRELEAFILELGKGFAFVERQKRMIIDGEDYYLDLLFYHRKLNRLVAIELKLGKFKASYKGQMELYLKWLDKYEKNKNEQPPIGLILCAEGSREKIELLEMHKDGIIVAEYLTELPDKKQLQQKLHQLLIEAKERIEKQKLLDN